MICISGCVFKALTTRQIMYVDNQTYIKSNKTISVDENAYLTLLIDYGLNYVTLFTSLTNGQVVGWDATNNRFIHSTPSSGVTQFSLLSDVSLSTLANDNVLIYTTNGSLNKWTNYSISGAVFNDITKTISISSSGALSGLSDSTITTPTNNQLL